LGRCEAEILFAQPTGYDLRLATGCLDGLADHLTWCYRFLGVEPGASIGVLDFGASPVSYLGSRFLTPCLDRGVAERLPGRMICLDASRERVAMLPALLPQFELDVLVVRDEIRPLVVRVCEGAGVDLGDMLLIDTMGFRSRGSATDPSAWRRLLIVEETMLMAPECPQCGSLHVADARYQVNTESQSIATRGTTLEQALPSTVKLRQDRCPVGPEDWLVSLGTERDPS